MVLVGGLLPRLHFRPSPSWVVSAALFWRQLLSRLCFSSNPFLLELFLLHCSEGKLIKCRTSVVVLVAVMSVFWLKLSPSWVVSAALFSRQAHCRQTLCGGVGCCHVCVSLSRCQPEDVGAAQAAQVDVSLLRPPHQRQRPALQPYLRESGAWSSTSIPHGQWLYGCCCTDLVRCFSCALIAQLCA